MRGVSGDLRATLHGTDRPLISRNQMIVRWEKIRERLEGSKYLTVQSGDTRS
jgi:hypothetical protein